MRIVAYLCLSFCLLSFDIHASSAPLVIKQGIEKQEFTVAITNEAKPVVEFEIEEDGLLIIEVKQRGHFLYERLWIDGKSQAYMDMFGFSEGSDFVSINVKSGEKVGLEVQASVSPKKTISVDARTLIISTTDQKSNQISEVFNTLNLIGVRTKQAYADSGNNFKSQVESIYELNNLALNSLIELGLFSSILPSLQFNQAVLLSDLGKRAESFEIFNRLFTYDQDKVIRLLTSYYMALLLPDYLEKRKLLSTLDEAITLSKGYNTYLYQNARLDKCTALQQQVSEKAVSCFQKIIHQELLIKSPLKLAVLQANLAHLYFSKHQYNQAISLGKDSLTTLAKIENIPELKQTYLKKKAIFEYQQSLRLYELGLESDALVKLLHSIEVFAKFNQHQFFLNALIRLGDIYQKSGQSEIAIYLAKYVFTQLDKKRKTDHFHLYRQALLLAIQSSLNLSRVNEAKSYITQLKRFIGKGKARDRLMVKLFQYELSPNSEALTELIKTYESMPRTFSKRAVSTLKLAELLINKKEYESAKILLSRIEKKKLSFRKKINLAILEAKISLFYGHIQSAETNVQIALDSIELQYSFLNNIGLKRHYYEAFKNIFELRTVLHLQQYQTTQNRKYLALASKLNLPKIERLQDTHNKSSSIIERRNYAKSLTQPKLSRANMRMVISELLTLESRHHKRIEKAKRLDIENKTLLDNQTATLHYVLMPERSLVFIYHNNQINYEWLPSEATINNEISFLFNLIGKNKEQSFYQAEKVKKLLIPLSVLKEKSINKLTIVGSGLIWQLPFNILPLTNNSGWQSKLLIDQYIIKKSISPYNHNSFQLSKIKQILSISDPVFSRSDKRSRNIKLTNKLATTLPRIKSSAKEIRNLNSYFENSQIMHLRGFSATKSNFLKSLVEKPPQLIHIASHSFSSIQSFRNTGIFFTAFDKNGKVENSLLGLDEIAQIQNRAQLVVLSSCESNVGKTSFKAPVDGLALAFLSSGSKRVLASQWQVPSKATAFLMDNFYKKLANSNSIEQALNQAQQLTRERYSSPFYWAGFTIITNNQGMHNVNEQKNNSKI